MKQNKLLLIYLHGRNQTLTYCFVLHHGLNGAHSMRLYFDSVVSIDSPSMIPIILIILSTRDTVPVADGLLVH